MSLAIILSWLVRGSWEKVVWSSWCPGIHNHLIDIGSWEILYQMSRSRSWSGWQGLRGASCRVESMADWLSSPIVIEPELMLYLMQIAHKTSRLPDIPASSLRYALWESVGPGTKLMVMILVQLWPHSTEHCRTFSSSGWRSLHVLFKHSMILWDKVQANPERFSTQSKLPWSESMDRSHNKDFRFFTVA